MSGLFSLLFLLSLVTLGISIVKPSLFARIISSSRKTLVLVNAGLVLLFFILTGTIATETQVDSIQYEKPSATPTQSITPASTHTPTPTIITITPTETPKPTATPTVYVLPTAKPTVRVIIPTTPPTQPALNSGNGAFTCNCRKTCSQMSSCAEAQYQLNVCGCKARDADKDGIACDAQCQ